MSHEKIITLIGDSLSMVRNENNIGYKDLYIYKLQQKLGADYYCIVRSRRANTVGIQTIYQNMHDDILYNNSRYIIICLGIVDCAPRIFSKFDKYYMQLIKPKRIVEGLVAFKSKHRRFFTRFFPKTYVSKQNFEKGLEEIVRNVRKKVETRKIIFLGINNTNKINEYRSYNFGKNIKEYNEIIEGVCNKNRNLCEFINTNKLIASQQNLLLEDGIHFSKSGHDMIADILYNKIRNLESSIKI